MAIYELFEEVKQEKIQEPTTEISSEKKGRLFSTVVTRFCFFLLLLASIAWFVYSASFFCIYSVIFLATGKKSPALRRLTAKFWLNLRRSLVSFLSLFVGLFSPPFGIMVACTYFLMYDKAGMEEVVPASLQAQFKDIFHTE